MATDIASLAFKVDTSDVDRGIKKLRELTDAEAAAGETGKKSGGLVSRAFSEASRELDKTLRSVTRLASELGALARISQVDIDVRLNTQSINRELSDLRSRLGGGVLTLDINADLTRVTSEIASLRQSGGVNVNVTATADTSRAIAEIDSLKKAASDVTMSITANADTGRALAELNSLRNQADQIRLDIDINVSGSATSAELNNVRTTVLSLNQAVLAGTRYLHDYNNELERIRGSAGDAADAIRRAADEQERLRNAGGGSGGGNGAAQSWMSLGNAIQFATGALGGFSLASAMTDTLQHARDIQRVSDALGVNAQALQEWELVAKKSGVEADKVADIFKDVSDKIGDFALTGGGEAKDLFDTLNLKIKDFKDLAPDKALEKMGEALKNSGLTRNQKVFLLEGLADDASLLLPKLENITEELAKARSIGEKSGSILSKADLAVLNEANKNIDALSTAWKGVANNAGVAGASLLNAFSPALQTAIGKTTELFDSLGGYTSILANNTDLLLVPLAAAGTYIAGALATAVVTHISLLATQAAGMTAAAIAAKALSTALSLMGGPLGLLAIGAGALTYTLINLSKAQDIEGKAIKDLHGKYIDYHDITKTVVSYNAEYVNASSERKKAIIEETEALKANVLAEINALDARLKTLQGNYQKAVMADAANAAPYVDDNGNLQYAVSLADKYKTQITELTEKIQGLRTHYENIGATEKANNEGRKVAIADLKNYKEETQQASKALEQQSAQLSITKQDQNLIAESFRKAVDVLRAHEDALKGTVESLQKQRIELEQGKAAAEYYAARLSGLTDAEAKAAAGANQYNTYLQERKRLQQEQAGLSGGLMDAYSAKLNDLGLGSLNFDGVVAQTDKAVSAADSYKFALQNADEAVKKLGVSAAQTMQTISAQTGEAVKVTAKQVGTAAQIVAEFQKLGWSRQQAIGIAANLKQESEFRTGAVGDGGKAYGLAQWHPDRQANFAKEYGKSIKDSGLLEQIKFVHHELTSGSEKAAGNYLRAATTAEESARVISRYYERPADKFVEMDRRAGIAKTLAKELGGVSVQTTAIATESVKTTAETAKTAANLSNQLTAVKYLGQIDGKRVTDAERQSLIYQYMGIEAQKLVNAAQDQINATTQNGLQLRTNQLTQQQFSADVQKEILARESMADYLGEEKRISLEIASIKDPSAPLREELAQKKLNAAQIESLVTLQQKAAVMKQLDDLQTNAGWIEKEIQATQQGVVAMNQLAATREADNLAKQAGVTLESALGQQILASVTALQAKQRELQVIKQLTDDQKTLDFLTAEITATKLGSAAVAEFNIQKEIRNKLDSLELTQESELGKRIAETTRQLAERNKQLEIAQSLYQMRTDNDWLHKEIEATKKGEKALKELNIQKAIFAELSRLGIKASSESAKQIEQEIRQQFGLRDALEETQKSMGKYSGLGDALAQGMLSGNWKQAGKDILAQLKGTFVDPLKKSLSDAIAQGLAGGANGGFLGSIAKLLNFDGIKGALGGVGNSIGGLFSGIASSAANGFAGIGTAISGGLSGIMGSFGTLVSAIPGWGWALAGVAGLAKLFGGPSAPKINLTQGARDGQGMLTDGQQHYTKTALGTVGATDSSYKIGREKGFVPKLHEWFKWVESFDGMIAKTLPNSIASISEALKGVEMKGANLEGFTRQRLHTIFSALPEALQAAIQGGKNIMASTTEEIAARFNYMAQVAESGLIPALEQLGLAGNQSKESMIALAMGLADAMGGIDKAKAALDAYYNAAYTDAERLTLSQSAAKSKLDEYNKSLGLSGAQYIDSIAKLRARIDAEDASTAAGQKNIATLLGMVDALKTLSGTAEEAAAKLKQQWTDFNAAAYTDSQRESIAKKQAQKLVDQFNQTYGTALSNIIDARQLMRTIDTTTEGGKKMQQALLGLTGSLVTLGGTAQQIKEKIAGLKEGIKGLVSNLYGSGSTTSTSTVATTDANQAALSAANATLDSLRSRYDEEKQRIDDVNSQAREAYNDQMDYYRAMHDAMQSLLDLANGFADDARSASDTLKAAQLDYNATLKAAQGGDVEAAKKLGDAANRLKTSLGTAYNNDNRAASAIQQIEQQLRSTAGILGNLAGTEPTDPGTIASTVLASLESQIKAQEAIVSSLQSVVSSTNSATNEAKAAADRTALAKELATKVGELGLATDKSAWQILAANGINIKDLATDFGINLSKLDTTFVKKTADLADRLNVNSLDLLTRLNVNFADLARSFNIDVNNLNNGTLTKLDKLADQLRVSSVDLAAKLGINIDQLGDLMANKLAALPNIPADIKAGLAPHLQDIRNAADPATLQRELKELQAYVNSLPPGIKDKLNDQLQGILGYTGDTKTNTKDTKTETMALRNVSGRISELTLYTRDELTGQYITKMLQNSRALNQNAANIGKSTIPSFAVGSDKLPNDMLANVHRGEMIFTAAQSNSMRDLAIYNQSVIPQIASYLSEIAANDEQAPVFIQPVYVAPVNSPQRRSESGRDELLEEVKGLRKDNAELKKAFEGLMPYQSAIANNTRKSAATLDKWDTDGVPEERVA